jgi:hypothetical protein
MDAVRRAAKEDKASMNQFFVTAVAEKLSALQTERLLKERARRADVRKFRKALKKVADLPVADERDRLDD